MINPAWEGLPQIPQLLYAEEGIEGVVIMASELPRDGEPEDLRITVDTIQAADPTVRIVVIVDYNSRRDERATWLTGRGCDLVFFDDQENLEIKDIQSALQQGRHSLPDTSSNEEDVLDEEFDEQSSLSDMVEPEMLEMPLEEAPSEEMLAPEELEEGVPIVTIPAYRPEPPASSPPRGAKRPKSRGREAASPVSVPAEQISEPDAAVAIMEYQANPTHDMAASSPFPSSQFQVGGFQPTPMGFIGNSLSIALMGTYLGVGVTHTVMLLADYFRDLNKSVSIVSMSRGEYGFVEPDQKGECWHNKIRIYPYGDEGYTQAHTTSDIVLYDCGHLARPGGIHEIEREQKAALAEYQRANVRILVGGLKAWQIIGLQRASEKRDDLGLYSLLIPMLNAAELRDANKRVGLCYTLPSLTNPEESQKIAADITQFLISLGIPGQFLGLSNVPQANFYQQVNVAQTIHAQPAAGQKASNPIAYMATPNQPQQLTAERKKGGLNLPKLVQIVGGLLAALIIILFMIKIFLF